MVESIGCLRVRQRDDKKLYHLTSHDKSILPPQKSRQTLNHDEVFSSDGSCDLFITSAYSISLNNSTPLNPVGV